MSDLRGIVESLMCFWWFSFLALYGWGRSVLLRCSDRILILAIVCWDVGCMRPEVCDVLGGEVRLIRGCKDEYVWGGPLGSSFKGGE